MSTTETKLMTAEELLRMPDDGFRYELVKGELQRMAHTGDEHGGVTMELAASLYQHLKLNNLGRVDAAETGFKLESNPDTVRAPDIAFVSRERIRAAGSIEGYRSGAPDLRSLIDVAVLTEKDMLHGGEVVPGFQISVAEIFTV